MFADAAAVFDVAQRGEPVVQLIGHVGGSRCVGAAVERGPARADVGQLFLERRPRSAHAGVAGVADAASLVGVGLEVVVGDLRHAHHARRPHLDRADELVLGGADRLVHPVALLAAHVLVRRVDVRNQGAGLDRPPFDDGPQAVSVDRAGRPQAGVVEQRRGQVRERDLVAARSGERRGRGRWHDEERDAEELVEERVPVSTLIVIEELLTVVGGHHDHGVIEAAAFGEKCEDLLDVLVGPADLAAVERLDVLEIAR